MSRAESLLSLALLLNCNSFPTARLYRIPSPATSVYLDALHIYIASISSDQLCYQLQVTTVIQPSATSRSAVTLPTADTTAANGNAGGDPTITAPDPGNTSFRSKHFVRSRRSTGYSSFLPAQMLDPTTITLAGETNSSLWAPSLRPE